MRPAAIAAAALAAALLIASCSAADTDPAELWTDVPELVLAAELFNSAQDRFMVAVQWKDGLAEAVKQVKEPPALVVGRYLKSQGVRDRLRSLDYLFGELVVNQAAFYPGLLSLGNIEGRQMLLPVSFNLPAIVFARDAAPAGDGFLLCLADMAPAARAFNKKTKESFTRMGFSPRWDGGFLVLAANAAGAGFKEGKPLAWNERGLAAGIESLRAWVAETNGSATLEDDFQFKYLFTPGYQYLSSGRALFAYVDSSGLFTIPEDRRSAFDYRWFSTADGAVPVADDIVYAALPRSGRGKQAAESFLTWFFREESQNAILESSRRSRAIERSFGVVGGFSSIRSVNERIFPLYYPALVGHLPPAEALATPNVLPSDWPELKEAVIAPWLSEVTGRDALSANPGEELAARIAEYGKKAAQR
jgi:ABC-type glycerol-3-phosphate transport system substrate-binding protein